MDWKITHEAPDKWTVYLWVEGGWLHRGSWALSGSFKTEAAAIKHITARAEFRPHTSYYDKYGNMHVAETDW